MIENKVTKFSVSKCHARRKIMFTNLLGVATGGVGVSGTATAGELDLRRAPLHCGCANAEGPTRRAACSLASMRLWTVSGHRPVDASLRGTPLHKTPTRDPSEAAPHRRIFLAWVPLPQEGKHPRVRRLRTSRGVHLNKQGQKYTGLTCGGNPLEG